MKTNFARYVLVALVFFAVGVLAHAGISRAWNRMRGAAGPAATAVQIDARPASLSDQDRKPRLRNPLLQKLWEVIAVAEQLDAGEKSQARSILEEADPVLARIKAENRKALERVKHPPRRIIPKASSRKPASAAKPAPRQSSEKPAPDPPSGN